MKVRRPAPLLPIHQLWINLVTDGLPALCLATDPFGGDAMKRQPRRRTERITNPKFVRSMFLTGFLTAGVAFAVCFYVLKTGTTETARAAAFAVLVFAELLRAFGARSETRFVWRISPFTNVKLLIVVALSIGFQLLSQHNAVVGRFLKTTYLSFANCLWLLALGAIPLLGLGAGQGDQEHSTAEQPRAVRKVRVLRAMVSARYYRRVHGYGHLLRVTPHSEVGGHRHILKLGTSSTLR
ncbi:MAG: cation-translocating P-type ATPase C-terminal domain-containing protein [Verrucomicrobiota bacterium]|nr:cation transporting ATPase C-terminal domain-containing protein [Verrucomicrobiota bacterium]